MQSECGGWNKTRTKGGMRLDYMNGRWRVISGLRTDGWINASTLHAVLGWPRLPICPRVGGCVGRRRLKAGRKSEDVGGTEAVGRKAHVKNRSPRWVDQLVASPTLPAIFHRDGSCKKPHGGGEEA